MKEAKKVLSGNKTQITILGCASAIGQVVSPMIAFMGKHLIHSYPMVKCLVHFMVCCLMGEWIRSYLLGSLTIHFLTLAVSERQPLLLLNGHLSYYALESGNAFC